MRFFRAPLDAQGCTPATGLAARVHPPVRVASLVLIRQKPGSAEGVCFVTLEDETGVIDVVVWRDVFARFRAPLMAARLLAVRGEVQIDGRVVHVVARHVEDRSDALGRLPDGDLCAVTGRGDHPTHPIAGQVDHLPEMGVPGTRGHPRDAPGDPDGAGLAARPPHGRKAPDAGNRARHAGRLLVRRP